MCRMQIHKKIVKLSIKLSLLVAISFVVQSAFVSAYTIDLGTWIDKWLDKLFEKTEKVSGKAVVQDLYDVSLSSIKKTQMEPLHDSIWDAATMLSDVCGCDISQQDVINILYYSSDDFKRDIKNLIGDEFEKPSRNDMKNSCNVFNSGIVLKNNPQWTVKSNTKTIDICQTKVSQVFIQILLNKQNSLSIWDSLMDSEAFFNGTLEDSSYDILMDVYDVAKILFEQPQEPPQVLFYDYNMPTLSNTDGVYKWNTSKEIDRFSPYNTVVTSGTQVQNSGQDVQYGSWSMGGQTWQNQWNNINGGADQDIKNFVTTIKKTNTETTNPETVYLWNDCVSWFSYQFYESGVIIQTGQEMVISGGITVDEYMEQVIEDIEALKCNNDYICQDWETESCADCIWVSGGVSDLEDIQDVLNAVQTLWEEELDEKTVECISNCRQVQKTVDSQIMCIAKCLCNTIESPMFDPIEQPWLWPIFKLKYCIIPVTEVSWISKEKKVKSIEGIFLEIHKLLEWLRNSGELMVSEKTRELIDSAYKKSNIASQLSFTITTDQASHVSQPSQATINESQIAFNTMLMTNLLWFSKNIDDRELNKYVVADDPCIYKYQDSAWTNTQSNRAAMIEGCRQENLQNKNNIEPDDVVSSLWDVKMQWIKTLYTQFMITNSEFWKQIEKDLEELALQAAVLSQKDRN